MIKAVVVTVFMCLSVVATQNIVCYYDNRAASYSTPTFPGNLSVTNCTHYVYDGVGVTAQGEIRILSSYDTASGFEDFQKLRQNGDIKLYVLLTSDRDGGKNLTNAIASRSEKLVNNIAIFVEQYNFHGVEIDRRTIDFDKNALARFVNRLRSRLYMINKQLAVSVSAQFTDAYDITSLSLYADMINFHAYSFTSPLANTVADLAPLYSTTAGVDSVNSTLASWLAAGVRKNKLNLVVVPYARTYVLVNESQRTVGSRSAGPGPAGPNTKRAGFLARYEFCSVLNDYTVVSGSVAGTTYYYKGKNWVSIETEDTLGSKFIYAIDNGLAGVAIYSLDSDDVNDACGTGAYRIAKLANEYLSNP
uniref:GH18 domain-containing protein n=1 Tax=Anopheles farauti TaxID=69004 RepID=A0A182QDP6_9DIPT